MNKENKISELVCMEVLKSVQVLYQNKQIDYKTKTKITALLKNALKDDNFSQLNAFFRQLVYSIGHSFYGEIEKCISLTA